MKSPSRNISRSLRGQTHPGRRETPIPTAKQTSVASSALIIPGEASVQHPPGKPYPNESCRYADTLGRMFGGSGT